MRSLVSLVTLLVFTLLIPNGILVAEPVVNISKPETIEVDPDANFQVTPGLWSFCFTEDKLLILPDPEAGVVKIFEKVFEENRYYLKLVTSLGLDGFDETKKFKEPRYCFYNYDKKVKGVKGTLGVFDYSSNPSERKVFIFERTGKVEFAPLETIMCPRFAYDMELSGDGQQVIVSGFTTDEDNKPFDLYSINIGDGEITYLMPSHEKYGLKDYDEYALMYRQEQILPSMGIKAYIDIAGDDLYFLWECSPRIIKLKLCSGGQREDKAVFEREHRNSNFSNLDEKAKTEMGKLYKKRDFNAVIAGRKNQTYISNVFATPEHVFLVYKTSQNNQSTGSEKYRLLIYNLEGEPLADIPIPGKPGKQMWLDEESDELYTIITNSGDNDKLSILRYKIEISK